MPDKRSCEKLKQLARYLTGQPRLVFKHPFQNAPIGIRVHVDTDVAGCKATGRNTSGGAALFGKPYHEAVVQNSNHGLSVLRRSGIARGNCDGLAPAIGLQSIDGDLGMA